MGIRFDIPIVLFTFRRKKVINIVNQIKKIEPTKLYILSDNGRNDKECKEVEECRELIEEAITWDCEVIKNYANKNRGVYQNIGLGAKWVLQKEKWAIFLEDDNLPEISFFRFCKELLELYENKNQILWICGTNYLGKYNSLQKESYVFTKHMLPCGWATWSEKFLKFYDGNLSLCSNKDIITRVKKDYINKRLYIQFRDCWMNEYKRIQSGKKPVSWDYQMDFAIKVNELYGICPCNNQIKNIGIDEYSEHGGTSFDLVMTRRFCGMESYPITFPLVHPTLISLDYKFEKEIAKIMLLPLSSRIKIKISLFIRKVLNVPSSSSIKEFILDKVKNKND